MEQEVVKVVVFDLNGTFYNKSSSLSFYKFICRKRPWRFRFFLEIGYYSLLKKLQQIDQTKYKENFFNYLNAFPPSLVSEYAGEFWRQEFPENFNKDLIRRFEKAQRRKMLLFCATGGLELYVEPLFKLYKVDGLAGTKVRYDGHTYIVDGVACKGEEKIARLEKYLKGKPYRIIEAYSNSREEILDKAEKAFLIKNGQITPY